MYNKKKNYPERMRIFSPLLRYIRELIMELSLSQLAIPLLDLDSVISDRD